MSTGTNNSTRYGKVMYQTAAWKRLRKRQLEKEPLCRYCKAQGHTTAATVADHVVPHRGDWKLFLDASNLQSLCGTCHSSTKQREEQGGARVRMQGTGVDGMPTSAVHPWNDEGAPVVCTATSTPGGRSEISDGSARTALGPCANQTPPKRTLGVVPSREDCATPSESPDER